MEEINNRDDNSTPKMNTAVTYEGPVKFEAYGSHCNARDKSLIQCRFALATSLFRKRSCGFLRERRVVPIFFLPSPTFCVRPDLPSRSLGAENSSYLIKCCVSVFLLPYFLKHVHLFQMSFLPFQHPW